MSRFIFIVFAALLTEIISSSDFSILLNNERKKVSRRIFVNVCSLGEILTKIFILSNFTRNFTPIDFY